MRRLVSWLAVLVGLAPLVLAQGGILTTSATIVTITAPTSSATYDAGTSATLTTLAGTAQANKGVTACTWTNNLGGSGSATGTTSWTVASIALTVGTNVITVTCPNAAGTGTDVISVTRSSGAALFTGTTRTAASCSTAHVQTQIDASSDGDIVQLPDCAATSWTSGISTTKKLWIRAQNYTPTDQGTCTRSVTLTNNASAPMFSFTTGNTTHVAMSGIRINEGTGDVNAVEVTGTGSKVFLLSDMCFEMRQRPEGDSLVVAVVDFSARGTVMWNGYIQGVGTGGIGGVGPLNSGIIIKNTAPWTEASTMGAADTDGTTNIYLEDSTCINTGTIPDLDDGGRAVFRYNTFDGCWGTTHGFTSAQFVGRHMELYNNVFSVTFEARNLAGRYYWIRAGTLVMTDNVVNNASFPSEFGNMTAVDSACEGCSGYPATIPSAPRQVGYGHNGSGYVQDPVYVWNNSGARGDIVSVDSGSETQIQIGRDLICCATAKPGYSKYTYPHPLRAQLCAGC